MPVSSAPRIQDMDREKVLNDYRIALRARRTDDAQTKAVGDGKAKFCIWGAGQEVAQLAEAEVLQAGDWMRGYYRDLASLLKLDLFTVRQIIAQVVGNTEEGCDPSSGGRMMAHHTGTRFYNAQGLPIDREGNVIEQVDFTSGINRASDVSSIGSQFAVALGLAQASNVFRQVDALHDKTNLSKQGREIVLVSGGDASAAEGVFWESMNQAAVHQVPLLVSMRNNGYGITVPTNQEIVHGEVTKAMRGFGGETAFKIIGPVKTWDYAATMHAFQQAHQYVRTTGRPVLVETLVTQPYGHSSSGSNKHKSTERMDFERDQDPITNLRRQILENGVATEDELAAIEQEEAAYVKQEAAAAWKEHYDPLVELSESLRGLYAELQSALGEQHSALLGRKIAELNRMAGATQGGYLSRGAMVNSIKDVLTRTRRARQGGAVRAQLDNLLVHIEEALGERYGSNVYARPERSPINRPHTPPEYSEQSIQAAGARIMAAWLAKMMAKDPRILLFGQDDGALGGVNTESLGLQGGYEQIIANVNLKDSVLAAREKRDQDRKPGENDEDYRRRKSLEEYLVLQMHADPKGFGEERVWDEPIAENSSLGKAIGMALRGLKPIVAAQYFDYAVYMAQQMRDELGSLRWRTDGGQQAPVIIRTRGHRLEGVWHAGSPMGMFMNIPGMRIVVPRNLVQSAAMMRSLLESDDPAFVVDPLMKMRENVPVPDNLDEMEIPLGQSEVLKPGEDLTIVTYGYCCDLALQAASYLQEEYDISVEVVDLQTLNPLDSNGVAAASIEKTGKVLMLDEDTWNGAAGMLMSDLLVRRGLLYAIDGAGILTAPDHMPAYANDGSYEGKPQRFDIIDEVLNIMDGVDGGEIINGERKPRLSHGKKARTPNNPQAVLQQQMAIFQAMLEKDGQMTH